MRNIRNLCLGGKGFSAVQFASAAILLLETKHHAVREEEMQLLLGRLSTGGSTGNENDARGKGRDVLQSMLNANALSVRPYSDWALDIPLEAYCDQGTNEAADGCTIITAPSAMDLYCMGRLRKKLDGILECFEKEQVGSL